MNSTLPAEPWLQADAIVARLAHGPAFPARDFLITGFGAEPCATVQVKARVSHVEQALIPTQAKDAKDCCAAVAAAIAACHKAGGGRVVIPAGNWFCAGPIVLRTNVHVHLKAGAHVFFSQRPEDFAKHGRYDCGPRGKLTLSRWQGNDCLNFSPMIYARGEDNIALTGEDWTACLDGQGGVPYNEAGDCWWTWQGAADAHALPALSEAGVPAVERVFGVGHALRPCMIEFIGCTNVLMEGYHVINTPFWQHHPVHCRNVVIRKVHAESLGPNNDGFDPEACDHVLIDQCTFDTGNDCIAIKAGKNRDTQFGPSQNIVIQNCLMHSGHGAVTLGSEMAGGIENVFARDLVFENKHWATNPLRTAIRIKTNMNRGGYLRHFYVKNVQIPNGVQTSEGAVITFDCDYAPAADPVRTRSPEVRDFVISNVNVGNVRKDGKTASCYQAIAVHGPVASDYNGPAPAPEVPPVRRVTIRDCDFGTPVNTAQPIHLYNVQELQLERVTIAGKHICLQEIQLAGHPSRYPLR